MNARSFLKRSCIAVLVLAALIPAADRGCAYLERRDTLRCIEGWGRLAPLPQSASKIEIESTGGMFTRGFRVSFLAPIEDIEAWLARSPGINDAKVESNGPITVWHIRSGGKAAFAEVQVDRENGSVRIHVHWS